MIRSQKGQKSVNVICEQPLVQGKLNKLDEYHKINNIEKFIGHQIFTENNRTL